MKESNQYYMRRTIITGASVFVVSVLAGVSAFVLMGFYWLFMVEFIRQFA